MRFIFFLITILFSPGFILLGQNCVDPNPQAHLILIPAEVVTMNGGELPAGSEISALFKSGDTLRCGGSILWKGTSTVLQVYGASADGDFGFMEGEQFTFQVRTPFGCTIKQSNITHRFKEVDGNKFQNFGISTIQQFDVDAPVLNITLDDFFTINCISESVVLKPTFSTLENLDIKWYLSDSLVGTMSSIKVNQGGLYSLKASFKNCTFTDTTIVIEDKFPPLYDSNLPNDTINACSGSKTTLFFPLASNDLKELKWNTGESTPEIEVDQSGLYILAAEGSNGCKAADSIQVIYQTSPIIALPDTLYLCGDSLLVQLKGAGDVYFWSRSTSNADSIWVYDEGLLEVTVSSKENCYANAATWIKLVEKPTIQLSDTLVCAGKRITLELPQMDLEFRWSTGVKSNRADFDSSGTYSLKVKDKYGCVSTDSFILSHLPVPKLALKDTLSGCSGKTIKIDASEFGIGFLWNTGSTASFLEVQDEGLYVVTVSNDFGCSSADSTRILYTSNPNTNWPNPITTCIGQTVRLDANHIKVPVQWSTGDQSKLISISQPGLYTLKYTNDLGCQFTDSVKVIFYSNPLISLPDSLRICQGQSQTLDVRNTGRSYSWNTGATTDVLNVQRAQLYKVTVTNEFGCKASDSTQLRLWNNPVVTLPKADTICPNENLAIDARSFGQKFRWSNGATTGIITTSSPGNFQVTVTDRNGCAGQGSIQVFAQNLPTASIESPRSYLCFGDSVILSGKGGAPFKWLDPSNTSRRLSAERILAKPKTKSTYGFIAENFCGTDTAFVQIEVRRVNGSAGEDTTILVGRKLKLQANGGKVYQWTSPEFPLSNPQSANPEVAPKDSTYFVVVIEDEFKCRLTDTVFIGVYSDITELIKPINLFTPNGDGKNDVLKFKDLNLFNANKITVFNRWGGIVFQQSDYQNDWDGTYLSRPLPPGVYYYVLELDEAVLKSSLTLIRN